MPLPQQLFSSSCPVDDHALLVYNVVHVLLMLEQSYHSSFNPATELLI